MNNEPRASWRSWGPRGDDGHAPSGGCWWPCHGIISCLLWLAIKSQGGSVFATYSRSDGRKATDRSRDRRVTSVQPAHAYNNRLYVCGEMSSLVFTSHSQISVALLCKLLVIFWIRDTIAGRKYNYGHHK